jgi:hypothetical protein
MQGTMIDDSHITELPAHAGFITFESLLDKINPSDQESTIDVAPLFTGAKTLRQGESVQAQVFVIDRYQPEHYDVNTTDWGTGAHMAAQSGGTMLLAWIKAKGSIYTLFGVYLAGRHVQGRMTDHVRLFEGMVKTGSKSNLYTSIQDVLKVRLQLIRSNKAPPGLQFLPLACWFEWEPSSRYEKRGSKPLPPKASTESDGLPESVSGAYTAAETMSKSGEGESSVSENRTWDAGTEGSCLPWSSWFTGDWWPCFAPGTAER